MNFDDLDYKIIEQPREKIKRIFYQWYVIDTSTKVPLKYKDYLHIVRTIKPTSKIVAGPFNYRQEARDAKRKICKENNLEVANPWYTEEEETYCW